MFIAKDKKEHLIAGFVIGMAVTLAFTPAAGIISGIVAGFGKEIYDYTCNWRAKRHNKRPPHAVELLDFAFTALGGLLGSVIMAGLEVLLKILIK